jgi:hypothetical protein
MLIILWIRQKMLFKSRYGSYQLTLTLIRILVQNNGSVCAFLSTVVHQFLIDNRFINTPPSASHHRNIESDHRPTKRRKISPAAGSPRQPSVSKGNTSDGQQLVISQVRAYFPDQDLFILRSRIQMVQKN